jgi:quercetin dioxygenase-like cupin family protein
MSQSVSPGADGTESLGDAGSHFTTEALAEPTAPGRYVNVDALSPVEFQPGLGFRPVLGQAVMTNFVSFAPGAVAPRHVHAEEQFIIILDGELVVDLDGDVRTMRKGDVAVIPSWVPHGAWTTDSHCEELDVFAPPRQTLLKLAEAHLAAAGQHRGDESAPSDAAGTGGGGTDGPADVA